MKTRAALLCRRGEARDRASDEGDVAVDRVPRRQLAVTNTNTYRVPCVSDGKPYTVRATRRRALQLRAPKGKSCHGPGDAAGMGQWDMPVHRIELEIPVNAIVNADARFVIYSDNEKLGELLISKGSLDWWPARRRKKVRLRWEAFAKLMEEHVPS